MFQAGGYVSCVVLLNPVGLAFPVLRTLKRTDKKINVQKWGLDLFKQTQSAKVSNLGCCKHSCLNGSKHFSFLFYAKTSQSFHTVRSLTNK